MLTLNIGRCGPAEVESERDSFSTGRSRFLLAAQQLPVSSPGPRALRCRYTRLNGTSRCAVLSAISL